ncbi:MAG TPA: methionyl-tRNA formyltransferase [Atribacteraceae bacterium]|nr:methionyl-tRNA formyltransferase [Atribacteraceae bacterium]
MKTVFLGTSVFALPVLEALFLNGHELAAVITQPDRPCGRGLRISPSAVKSKAEELGIPVWQPVRVNAPDFLTMIQDVVEPEVLIVAAYGQILRKKLLSIPRRGCINVHASLLPAYRGADPIRWTLLRGEQKTGVTIMLMDEGVDTGPILSARELLVNEMDNAETLTSRLGQLGSGLLIETLAGMEQGEITPRTQDNEKASYAPPMTRQMVQIDWRLSAREIVNQIRAFSPCPGAYGILNGKRIHILRASVGISKSTWEPGTVIGIEKEQGILVATGEGMVTVTQLKPENRKALHFRDFCCGYRLAPGAGFSVE